MIELQSDRLVVSFPEVHPDAVLTVAFQRALRRPVYARDYVLPPEVRSLPLLSVDHYAQRVPADWLGRGGVLLPMWQSEAVCLHFQCRRVSGMYCDYPMAVKVAKGQINALNGRSWRGGLSQEPQGYMVVERESELKGYCVLCSSGNREATWREMEQFVATPLSGGDSGEGQSKGGPDFVGLQIEVLPMRREAFGERFLAGGLIVKRPHGDDRGCRLPGFRREFPMAPTPGSRMSPEFYVDPFEIHDWDTEHGSRCFVHLLNSLAWFQISGTKPPSTALTSDYYSEAGYPWNDYYGAEAEAAESSDILAGLKSVRSRMEAERRSTSQKHHGILLAIIRALWGMIRRR